MNRWVKFLRLLLVSSCCVLSLSALAETGEAAVADAGEATAAANATGVDTPTVDTTDDVNAESSAFVDVRDGGSPALPSPASSS